MLSATKRFISLALAAAMVVALLFSAQSASANDGKAALKFIPKDNMMVLSVNLTRIKGSPLYKTVMGMLTAEPDFQEMVTMLKTKAGFDIETDIENVVVAVPPDVDESENFIIIAYGKFDAGKIISLMQAEGAKLSEATHEGIKYHEIDGEGAVVFSGNQAILGSKEMVKMALSASVGKGDNINMNPTISKLIGSVDCSKDVWFVFELPDALKQQMGPNPMINDIKTVTSSIDIKSGLGLRTSIGTSNAGTAGNLAQMINSQLPALSASPDMKSMGFDAVISKVKISTNGANLDVALDLTDAEFQKLQESVMKMFMGGF